MLQLTPAAVLAATVTLHTGIWRPRGGCTRAAPAAAVHVKPAVYTVVIYFCSNSPTQIPPLNACSRKESGRPDVSGVCRPDSITDLEPDPGRRVVCVRPGRSVEAAATDGVPSLVLFTTSGLGAGARGTLVELLRTCTRTVGVSHKNARMSGDLLRGRP